MDLYCRVEEGDPCFGECTFAFLERKQAGHLQGAILIKNMVILQKLPVGYLDVLVKIRFGDKAYELFLLFN